MEVLASEQLWEELVCLAQTSQRKQCAVAYVTDATALDFRRGDILVVDAADSAISAGHTSAAELEKLFRRGVLLYCLEKLHAKIYLFCDCVVVGSCNLSLNSRETLIEVGMVARDEDTIVAAQRVLNGIRSRATPIDQAFIERILQIPVKQSERSPEFLPDSERNLWYLTNPPLPISNDMKCYFHAFITAQIGELHTDTEFHLWPGPKGSESFRAHMGVGDKDRLRKDKKKYRLTETGVKYFEARVPKLDPEKVNQFRSAILSGDPSQLPETVSKRSLKQL